MSCLPIFLVSVIEVGAVQGFSAFAHHDATSHANTSLRPSHYSRLGQNTLRILPLPRRRATINVSTEPG